jgi:hypothetical protein
MKQATPSLHGGSAPAHPRPGPSGRASVAPGGQSTSATGEVYPVDVTSTNGATAHDTADPASEVFKGLELGEVGLKQNRGRLSEEWQNVLRGEKGRKVYRQMSDNDPVLGPSLYALRQLCRRVEWRTVPPEDRDEDDPDTVFAESLRHDMSHSWSAMIDEIFTGMPVYGWQVHEVVVRRRKGEVPGRPGDSSRYSDGLIGWRKLALRKQDTLDHWEFDDEGGLSGMWQKQSGGNVVLIPVEQMALFRTTQAGGNPEGRSALRNAYRPWWFKTRIEEQEAIGVERDLTGIPWFQLPPELLDPNATGPHLAAKNGYEQVGKNLRVDEQAVLMTPLAYDSAGNKRYDFELIGSPGTHPIDTQPIITRHNQTMAMCLLADVILLGHEKVGTQALAVSKVDLLAASLDAWLDGIAEVFNRHLLPRIFGVNGRPTGELPTYEPQSVKPDDVAATVEMIAKLAQAGAPLFPDEGLEDWLAEEIGYPMPDHEAIVPMPEPTPPPVVVVPGAETPAPPPHPGGALEAEAGAEA